VIEPTLETNPFAVEIDTRQKVRPFCYVGRWLTVFELEVEGDLPWLTENVPWFISEVGSIGEDSRFAAGSRESHVLLVQVSFHLLTLRPWL
jgi:hypothetical protein